MIDEAAQDRERQRICDQLLGVGVELWEGDGADAGYLLGRETAAAHTPACTPLRCACTSYAFRVPL